jgi:hypothetical protein
MVCICRFRGIEEWGILISLVVSSSAVSQTHVMDSVCLQSAPCVLGTLILTQSPVWGSDQIMGTASRTVKFVDGSLMQLLIICRPVTAASSSRADWHGP